MIVKNVIIISDFGYIEGGAAKVAIDTANILASNGYNVLFLTASSKISKEIDNKVIVKTSSQNEFLSYKNKIKGMLYGLINKKFANFIMNELKNFSNKDTVIHVHGWTKSCSAYFFKIISKMNFKCVVTLHDYFYICPNGGLFNYKRKLACKIKPYSFRCKICNCDSRNYMFKIYRVIRESFYKKYMNSALNYVCVSDFQKEILDKYTTNHYTVIENPLEVDNIPYSSFVKKYDFAYIGRTSVEKGIELFINLAKVMPNKRFIIVGNYDKETPSNIFVTGWLDEKNVKIKLFESNCLVLPSLWPETFGLNVYKACRYGIKCIVSDNTASGELIKKNGFGLVFKQNDFNDLCEKARLISREPTHTNSKYIINKDYLHEITNFYMNILNK